jgi:hypothetical protein
MTDVRLDGLPRSTMASDRLEFGLLGMRCRRISERRAELA